jgi:hypothetical protein
MAQVKPTAWDVLKTDAINLAKPFLWLDDDPMSSELAVLKKKGKEGSLRLVDLRRNPFVLHDILEELVATRKFAKQQGVHEPRSSGSH